MEVVPGVLETFLDIETREAPVMVKLPKTMKDAIVTGVWRKETKRPAGLCVCVK